MCAAKSIFTSSFYNFDKTTVTKVGKNAVADIHNSFIVGTAECVAILQTNLAKKLFSVSKQEKYNTVTRCYNCSQKFIKMRSKES